MLVKLFKHELKDTGKILLPLNLALIGVTILGMIMLGLRVFNVDHIAVGILAISLILFYVLAIIALFVVTYIYLMMRFYRSMYSDEGYLTHTLPVSTFAVLNTKIIVSALWAFLTMILTVCSVFALIITGIKSSGVTFDVSMSTMMSEFESLFGMSTGAMIGWLLLFMLLSSFSGLLMIYCSMSIGQLFNKHKVTAAVVTYIIIYIVLQIESVILSLFKQLDLFSSSSYYAPADNATFQEFFGGTFTAGIIQSVILILIYYITCAYITNKHLNLD